jgi:hypothetical protein
VVSTKPLITATVPLPSVALDVMNLDGSRLRTICKPKQGLLSVPIGRASAVCWGERRVGFVEHERGERVIPDTRVDVVTGAQQVVVNDALDPTVSGDGKQLAYLHLRADDTMELVVAAADWEEHALTDDVCITVIFVTLCVDM